MLNGLTVVKQHLRVTSTSEDTLIGLYMDAAEESIKNFIDQDIPGSDFSPPDPVPNPILAAQLLIIGDMYENREAGAVGVTGGYSVNPTVENLLYPYRRLGV